MRLDEIEAREATYRFLAEVFLSPIAVPGVDFSNRAMSLLDALGEDESLCGEVRAAAAAAMREAAELGSEEWQKRIAVDRTRLFRGAGMGAGYTAPYESSWRSPDKPEAALLDVAHLFAEAGLAIAHEATERLDYLGVELMFAAKLCRMQREEQNARYASVEEKLIDEHLRKWVPDYCESMSANANTAFMRFLSALITAYLL